jgi:CHASE1-domain containing sensor protein
MTTQLAFAFGVLMMIAIIMLVTIVVGMVKVIKLEKQLKEFDRAASKETEFLHRHMTDVERAIYSEINETRNRFDRYTEDFRRELMAYTDSRVDKSLGAKEKQILKS